MTEQEDGHEAEEQDLNEGEQNTPDPQVEARAREMGWVPQDEFRGDADNWRPADEFVKRGEEFIPFIKADRDKYKRELDGLKGKVSGLEEKYRDKIERMERMNAIALEEQEQNLRREYASRKRQAVAEGDTETYDALDKQEQQALSDLSEKTKQPEPKGKDDTPALPAHVQETVDAWVADNQWFKSDAEMQAVASAHHGKLLNDKPGLTLEENLNEVREYVKSKYPEKFGVKQEQRGSPIEPGSRGGSNGSGQSLWSKLPKEAKEQAERMIKNGQFAMDDDGKPIEAMPKRRERYAQMYFGDEA